MGEQIVVQAYIEAGQGTDEMADSLESALPSSATGASSNKVNINTASASELVSLVGWASQLPQKSLRIASLMVHLPQSRI